MRAEFHTLKYYLFLVFGVKTYLFIVVSNPSARTDSIRNLEDIVEVMLGSNGNLFKL